MTLTPPGASRPSGATITSGLLGSARVVGRVHVDDLPWPHPVELDNGIPRCPGEVLHPGRQEAKGPRWHRLPGLIVELVAHAKIEGPRDDGHVLHLLVEVGRNL